MPYLARLVLAQARLDLGRTYRAAPIPLEHLDVDAKPSGSIAPAHREPAAFQHQDLVPLREHVGQRRFPRAMPIGDVDVRASLGSEQPAEIAQQAIGELHQWPGIDVYRRAMHRPQDLVGYGGWTGDRQELASGSN